MMASTSRMTLGDPNAVESNIEIEQEKIDLVNGDSTTPADPFVKLAGANASLPLNQTLVEIDAPQLNYNKFITMQDKRVVLTIRYSEGSNLKPYFLTVAKKLKATHPDCIVERRILPKADEGSEDTFEVLVDGKVVVGKGRARRPTRVDMSHDRRSVFVSMDEIDVAVSRARRRRRPSTTYGEDISK